MLLDLPEHAWFDVQLMHKDIRLARQTASELQIPLPTATVADQLLTQAQNLGYAHRDLAALHDVLAHTLPRCRVRVNEICDHALSASTVIASSRDEPVCR